MLLPRQLNATPLLIQPLTGGAYVYTTWKDLGGYRFPSNSMYVVTQAGVVMIDTPWDSTQFDPLMDSIAARHHLPVIGCVVTHFHDDRTAGLDFFASRGIPTWSSQRTAELCRSLGELQATYTFSGDTLFRYGEYTFEMYYPGPGHSPDNIVIWIPELRLLYGGCLVKSTQVKGLGNLEHADTANWPASIHRLIERYPHCEWIIPGHYGWTRKNALKHTLKLLRKSHHDRQRKS